MPSSTPWRHAAFRPDHRPHSPVRPTAFERLSPDPYPTTATFDGYHERHAHEEHGNGLYGLGVFYNSAQHARNGLTATVPLQRDTPAQAQTHQAKTTALSNGFHRNMNRHDPFDWHSGDSGRPNYGSRNKGPGHTRSGSTIDDLASAAIAYSPTFPGSPSTTHHSRPATSHISGYDFPNGERATKRIKSEKLHATEWSRQETRPATSHVDNTQALEDAQLLLVMLAQSSPKPDAFPTFSSTHQKPALPELSPPPQPIQSVDGQETRHEITQEAHPTPVKFITVPQNGVIPPPGPHEDDLGQMKDTPLPVPDETNDHHDTAIHRKQSLPLDLQDVKDNEKASDEPPNEVKKQRRVKPEKQQSCCAVCSRMQAETAAVDDDFAQNWISCNACTRWFHSVCVGFKDKRDVQGVDKFICPDCEPVHGPTTYVRKSSRARTAIDYAGLHQGVIKSSSATAQHHYIQPIKDGTLAFHPDDFPRLRPELVTADGFEKSNGWKRPFVVPAAWNPRFGIRLSDHSASQEETAVEEAQNSDGETVVISSHTAVVDEEVFDCDQDYLDMVMPRGLTVRHVSELYGPEAPVPVIDVKSQQSYSDKKWNLKRWADYYESVGDKPVRNVISLEVSDSLLGRLIRRPRVVRELDIQDAVWPASDKERKSVGFYCLMSVADSYTDFHIDFGGSSVYYHILKGRKTFFFIPPEDRNLKKYEDWCNSDTQDTTFLGDLTGDCTRVDLYPGDTAFIPAGWIHAVWTPEDSLVIGGNFLTRLNYELQIKVANIERDTKVPAKFRYPYFQRVMWYTLLQYLDDDPVPEELLQEFYEDEHYVHLRAIPVWQEVDEFANHKELGDLDFHARYYSKAEIEGLPALRDYLHRTALIASDFPFPDMKKETVRAVQRSIPKGYGEPMELVKRFGIWCAWKIGNVTAPDWCHPDADEMAVIAERAKARKLEAYKAPPERVSSRVALLTNRGGTPRLDAADVESPVTPVKVPEPGSLATDPIPTHSTSSSKSGGSGPKRLACDACRQRRIKCRHREGNVTGRTESPEVTRPRSYSNISGDVFRSSSVPSALTDGAMLLEQPNPDLLAGHNANTFVSAGLAQAALAQITDPSASRTDLDSNTAGNANMASSKKGRTKACDECRKSKRRCVHDEYGHVDPAKAAEPTKPRGSMSSKRPPRPSNEHIAPGAKRPKLEGSSDYGEALHDEFEGMIDPVLLDHAPRLMQPAADAIRQSMHEMTASGRPPALAPNAEHHSVPSPPHIPASLSIPTSETGTHTVSTSPEVVVKAEPMTSLISPPENQTPLRSLASPPDSTSHDVEPDPVGSLPAPSPHHAPTSDTIITTTALDTPTPTTSASRHSSRQPKNVDRFVPDTFKPKLDTRSTYDTGGGGGARRTSTSAGPTPERKERNVSGSSSGGKAALDLQDSSRRLSSRDGSLLSESDADEKLARELQAAENGLRKRSMRV